MLSFRNAKSEKLGRIATINARKCDKIEIKTFNIFQKTFEENYLLETFL